MNIHKPVESVQVSLVITFKYTSHQIDGTFHITVLPNIIPEDSAAPTWREICYHLKDWQWFQHLTLDVAGADCQCSPSLFNL